jgi:hypothetical protein
MDKILARLASRMAAWRVWGGGKRRKPRCSRQSPARRPMLENLESRELLTSTTLPAVEFDGQSGYVSVGTLAEQSFTFAAWVKRDAGAIGQGQQTLISADANGGWGVGFDAYNKLFLDRVGTEHVLSTATVADTNWHFVAVVHNGADSPHSTTFYIDDEGVLASNTVTDTWEDFSSAGYNLGCINWSGTKYYYKGLMDEVAVWHGQDGLLDIDDMDDLYNSGVALHADELSEMPAYASLLVGYHFDEVEGTSADNYAGTSLDGELHDGATWVLGPPTEPEPALSGLYFDGTGYLATDNFDLQTFTFTAWVKRDESAISDGQQTIMSSAYYGGWGIGFDDDDTVFLDRIGTGHVNSTATVANDDWHFVCVTHTTNTTVFYIDDNDPVTRYDEWDPFASPGGYNYANIGSFYWDNYFYRGALDESALWSRVLDAETEIDPLYADGVGVYGERTNSPFDDSLELLYHFDEGDGRQVYDSSGNGHHGLLSIAGCYWDDGWVEPPPVTVSIADAECAEDDGTMTFTVTLSEPAPVGGVTVNYHTVNGTAIYDDVNDEGDYTGLIGPSQYVTILNGQTTATFTVDINNDAYIDGMEQFYVYLDPELSEVAIAQGRAIGTITDDDTPTPSISGPETWQQGEYYILTIDPEMTSWWIYWGDNTQPEYCLDFPQPSHSYSPGTYEINAYGYDSVNNIYSVDPIQVVVEAAAPAGVPEIYIDTVNCWEDCGAICFTVNLTNYAVYEDEEGVKQEDVIVEWETVGGPVGGGQVEHDAVVGCDYGEIGATEELTGTVTIHAGQLSSEPVWINIIDESYFDGYLFLPLNYQREVFEIIAGSEGADSHNSYGYVDQIASIFDNDAIVELHADSNQDGLNDPCIESQGTDDPIEHVGIGGWVGGMGQNIFTGADELTEVRLSFDTDVLTATFGENITNGLLTLMGPSSGWFTGTLNVWRNADRTGLLLNGGNPYCTFGFDDWPEIVYVEGADLGIAQMSWIVSGNYEGGMETFDLEDTIDFNVVDELADTEVKPTVNNVEFVQVTGDHYGTLEKGTNPDGTNGTPDFLGGDRFFPDAETYSTNDVARNIVHVRATVTNASVGDPIWFRAYDVDDPSDNSTIDSNGIDGSDNRGRILPTSIDLSTLGAGDAGMPGPPMDPNDDGFAGYLREYYWDDQEEEIIVGRWHDENGTYDESVVEATVQEDPVTGELFAEADLATSFAPGDNFRVAASFNKEAFKDTLDTASYPEEDGVVATPQLSVWRKFHVEQDLMTQLQPIQGDWIGTAGGVGWITQVGPANTPAAGQREITLSIPISEANLYAGGLLYTSNRFYPIVSNTSGANAHLIVEDGGTFSYTTTVTLYQDDYVVIDNAAYLRVNTADVPSSAALYGMLQPTTRLAENPFAQAYLQPDLLDLDPFDSNVDSSYLPAVPHADTTVNSMVLDMFDSPAEQHLGSLAYNSDLYWTMYVSTAHEGHPIADLDPNDDCAGGTDMAMGYTTRHREGTLMFMEPIRDFWANGPVPNVASVDEYFARKTIHELGHQFDLARTLTYHRSTPPNIMKGSDTPVPLGQFLFAPEELAYLRALRLPHAWSAITGPSEAAQYDNYTLELSSDFIDVDHWNIDWGGGEGIEFNIENTDSIYHQFSTVGEHFITAYAVDSDGVEHQSNSFFVTVDRGISISKPNSCNENSVNVVFTVTLTSISDVPVSIPWQTVDFRGTEGADWTALPGQDYGIFSNTNQLSGTLVIPANDPSMQGTISIPILNDSTPEEQEYFGIVLSNPSVGILTRDSAVASITDNDPGYFIDYYETWENDGDTHVVVKAQNIPSATTIYWHTESAPSNSATYGSDYDYGSQPSGSGTCDSDSISVSAGWSTYSISVPIMPDGNNESDEFFGVHITDGSGNDLPGRCYTEVAIHNGNSIWSDVKWMLQSTQNGTLVYNNAYVTGNAALWSTTPIVQPYALMDSGILWNTWYGYGYPPPVSEVVVSPSFVNYNIYLTAITVYHEGYHFLQSQIDEADAFIHECQFVIQLYNYFDQMNYTTDKDALSSIINDTQHEYYYKDGEYWIYLDNGSLFVNEDAIYRWISSSSSPYVEDDLIDYQLFHYLQKISLTSY